MLRLHCWKGQQTECALTQTHTNTPCQEEIVICWNSTYQPHTSQKSLRVLCQELKVSFCKHTCVQRSLNSHSFSNIKLHFQFFLFFVIILEFLNLSKIETKEILLNHCHWTSCSSKVCMSRVIVYRFYLSVMKINRCMHENSHTHKYAPSQTHTG